MERKRNRKIVWREREKVRLRGEKERLRGEKEKKGIKQKGDIDECVCEFGKEREREREGARERMNAGSTVFPTPEEKIQFFKRLKVVKKDSTRVFFSFTEPLKASLHLGSCCGLSLLDS